MHKFVPVAVPPQVEGGGIRGVFASFLLPLLDGGVDVREDDINAKAPDSGVFDDVCIYTVESMKIWVSWCGVSRPCSHCLFYLCAKPECVIRFGGRGAFIRRLRHNNNEGRNYSLSCRGHTIRKECLFPPCNVRCQTTCFSKSQPPRCVRFFCHRCQVCWSRHPSQRLDPCDSSKYRKT